MQHTCNKNSGPFLPPTYIPAGPLDYSCALFLHRLARRIQLACCALLFAFVMFSAPDISASVTGRISGTVTDQSGAPVFKVGVTVADTQTGIQQTVETDDRGFYSFSSLPVGHYVMEISSSSFRPYRRTAIVVDANSSLTIDAVLLVGSRADEVEVVENQVAVETTSTQMGEVVTGAEMTAVPLNGRSYTDLLALQPGVAPVTSITSETVQDVGASALSPSGDLNPGTISINGQREFANSFHGQWKRRRRRRQHGRGDRPESGLHRRVSHSYQ